MVVYMCWVFLVLIVGASSAIISSPGIKRVYVGESCMFQWKFTGQVNSYDFQNRTTTPPSGVSRKSSQIDRSAGVITLNITNIALWDAGNYSLIVDDIRDTSALLYIYQIPGTPRLQSNDFTDFFPVVQQGRLTICCISGGINSRPSVYATQVVYVFERDGQQVNGQLDRHNISGNCLSINPIERGDRGRLYRCKQQETGSRLESNYSAVFRLFIHEFESQPPAIQRKNQDQDYALTWKLSYDICDFAFSYYLRYPFSITVRLQLSTFGTISSIYLYGFDCPIEDVVRGSPIYSTRAYFNVLNSSITFFLTNIVLADAGDYTLTIGSDYFSAVYQQQTTTLFVNGYPSVRVTQTPNIGPLFKGSTVQVICSANSTSMPEIQRLPLIYTWRTDGGSGNLNARSDGYVELGDGTIVDRYTISNDRRTLTIRYLNAADSRVIYCCASEQESQIQQCAAKYLNVYYAPIAVSANPLGKKVNAFVPSRVRLIIELSTNPWIEYTTWTFVDRNGVGGALPDNSFALYNQILFILSSSRFYGRYTHFMNNSQGSTQTEFMVLPPAKPEVPANFHTYLVTSASIFLQWNCSWDNGLQQLFTVQLRETLSNTVTDTRNVTAPVSCLSNVTFQVKFESDIKQETDYEVSLWSSNDMGSIDAVRLNIITPARPKLVVSSSDISFRGSSALINYSIVNGKATRIKIECCLELRQVCIGFYFNVENGTGVLTLANLPNDSHYALHFYLFDGRHPDYSLVAFFDIRISLTNEESSKGSSSGNLLPAVVVLAILLCVSLSFAVALGIVFLTRRRARNSSQRSTAQDNHTTPEGVVNPAVVADLESERDEMPVIYEGLTERERYQEPKQLTYESLRLEENPKERRKFQKH